MNLPAIFRPPAPVPAVASFDVPARYAHFRPRILLWTTVGYGVFYLVRKNLALAMPVMEHQLGITKSNLGLFLTLHGLLYGVSKFANGVAADRANARTFMAIGLLASAIVNVFFGISSAVVTLGVLWMVNGWFQGMGYPPCARLLTHWFAPRELARKMAVWNASHTIGASVTLLLCGWLITTFNNWRLCFFVPAAIAIATAVALMLWLRDTPESIGLPAVDGTETANPHSTNQPSATALVFSNKYIWLVSGANFFVYILRFAVFDWGPTMLKEVKGVQLGNAAWMLCGFEVAGWMGVLVTGWLTDKVFKSRGVPLCLISMLLAGGSIYLFWKAPAHRSMLNTTLLMLTGFFIYSPQALIAVVVANLATKRAAATAVGLTSIFGYASTVLSGWGLGWLVQHHGWNPAFACLILSTAGGSLLLALALPAKAHGYGSRMRI